VSEKLFGSTASCSISRAAVYATRSRRSTSQGLPGAQLPRATLAAWSRKQEMLDAVWAGVVVADESLVQSILQLRQKLGDQDHRLINSRAPSAI
jgi:hypothetical protein